MTEFSTSRRAVLRGVGTLGAIGVGTGAATAQPSVSSLPPVKATYRALVDAVVPRTPELADELGPEHVPGGLDVGLDEYVVVFVDRLFSVGVGDDHATVPLSDAVAGLLDAAAAKLVATGGNEDTPRLERVLDLLEVDDLLAIDGVADDPERALQQSLFASLSRMDRLRAIAQLDAVEFDTTAVPAPASELDAALVGQLVVGFVELIYYSEWAGYEDFSVPPSERAFSASVDGEQLPSWQQTDFPGITNGAAVLRGYWSKPGSSLGDGAVWRNVAGDESRQIQLREDPGAFVENDYDTGGYEEVYATDGTPASEGPIESVESAVTGDAGDQGADDDPGIGSVVDRGVRR